MEPLIVRLVLVLVVVAGAAVAGLLWRRRDGRVRVAHEPDLTPGELDDLGLPDAPARAVLLSSPTCAPCVTVRAMLDGIADDGFAWVSVDADDHLDLVRRHRVQRVPTVLVLDRSGHVVARASGVPHPDELATAIDVARARRTAEVA